MTVGLILETKGFGVESARPETLISDILVQLEENNIGAIVIMDARDRLMGILSERDIVRAMAGGGKSVLTQKASTLMTERVVTALESQSAADVMRMMTEGKFRHVPIVRQGQLIGLISIGDLVKHRISQLETEAEAFRQYIRAA